MEAHRAEQNILRRPVERDIVRFEPDAFFVFDRDRSGAQVADPAAAHVIDLDAPEPPNTRAIAERVHNKVRGGAERDHGARANKRATAREGPPAFAPAWLERRLLAQNAWPRLI